MQQLMKSTEIYGFIQLNEIGNKSLDKLRNLKYFKISSVYSVNLMMECEQLIFYKKI